MAATAAAAVVTVETGLQVVSQLLSLIQAAQKANTPINVDEWNAVVGARDAAIQKLDADIAASSG